MPNTILQRQTKVKKILNVKMINLEKIKWGKYQPLPSREEALPPLKTPAPAPYFLHPLLKFFQIPFPLRAGGN